MSARTRKLTEKTGRGTCHMYIVVHILLSLHVSIGYNGWQWFAGGLLCGIGLVGAGSLLTRRILYPNPEVVFQSILPKLRASPEVAQLVARHLQPGLFRAYSHIGGTCLLYTSPSPRDATLSRMPSSA